MNAAEQSAGAGADRRRLRLRVPRRGRCCTTGSTSPTLPTCSTCSNDGSSLAPSPLRCCEVVLDASSTDAIGYDPQDGEPYNSRERAFAARIGPLAGWLHAGRPRREATRLAFRLHLRRHTAHVVLAAADLAQTLADRAGDYRDTLFADQTYLQHAQPSTVGHYLLSFAYPAVRDGHRLLDVIDWLNGSPAGAGCVNGTRLQHDRAAMADAPRFRHRDRQHPRRHVAGGRAGPAGLHARQPRPHAVPRSPRTSRSGPAPSSTTSTSPRSTPGRAC